MCCPNRRSAVFWGGQDMLPQENFPAIIFTSYSGCSLWVMKLPAITLSLLAMAGVALAQQPDRERERPAAPEPSAASAGVLGVLDFNRDGKLDQREIDLAVVGLRRLDQDGDGTVSAEEMTKPPQRGRRPGGPGGPGGERPGRPEGSEGERRGRAPNFATIDADGDGKISKEEAPDRMKQNWDRLDRNSDGVIDKEEQEAISRFVRDRGQGGERPDRQRRNGGRSEDGGQGETEKPKRPQIEE